MPGLRVEHLIDRIRRKSKNTNYGDNHGISQRLAQDIANEALKEVWRAVVLKKTSSFLKAQDYDIVSGTASYALPTRLFLEHEIAEVHYSQTGNDDDFYALNPGSIEDREQFSGTPDKWIEIDGAIHLSPTPNQNITGGLRVYYRERMPWLSIRHGVTNTSGTVFNTSSLVFTTGPAFDSATTPFEPEDADDLDWLCIVDKDGAMKVRNIRITAINSTTGAITVASGWTGTSSDTAIITGYYYLSGKDAASYSPLDGEFDEFIVMKGAALMALEDKDLELADALNAEAEKIKADLVKLFAPSHRKGRQPIKGFNDTGDPHKWY